MKFPILILISIAISSKTSTCLEDPPKVIIFDMAQSFLKTSLKDPELFDGFFSTFLETMREYSGIFKSIRYFFVEFGNTTEILISNSEAIWNDLKNSEIDAEGWGQVSKIGDEFLKIFFKAISRLIMEIGKNYPNFKEITDKMDSPSQILDQKNWIDLILEIREFINKKGHREHGYDFVYALWVIQDALEDFWADFAKIPGYPKEKIDLNSVEIEKEFGKIGKTLLESAGFMMGGLFGGVDPNYVKPTQEEIKDEL